jgi:hypothetical protein
MKLLVCALLAAVLTAQTPGEPTLARLLSRVAEEAEAFYQIAPRLITREVLEQRASMPPSRFRPRAGQAALELRQPRIQVREVVSEYSIGPLQSSERRDLVEFRQVTTVDGRAVQSVERARHALSLGMRSADESVRKRMLEEFARHGLVDLATDYGLILLAFTKRGQADMHITPAGQGLVGAHDARSIAWQQISGGGGELAFHGKQVLRNALQGTLWVRQSDGLPLRIEVWTEQVDSAKHTIRNEATVDYEFSAHGFVTPVSVLHRYRVDSNLVTENHYRYDAFKLFSADAEIKFTEVPDPSTLPVKK